MNRTKFKQGNLVLMASWVKWERKGRKGKKRRGTDTPCDYINTFVTFKMQDSGAGQQLSTHL